MRSLRSLWCHRVSGYVLQCRWICSFRGPAQRSAREHSTSLVQWLGTAYRQISSPLSLLKHSSSDWRLTYFASHTNWTNILTSYLHWLYIALLKWLSSHYALYKLTILHYITLHYHNRPPNSTPSPKYAGCVEKRCTVHRSLCRPIAYLLVFTWGGGSI